MTRNRHLSAIRDLLLPGKAEKLSITTPSTFHFRQLPMNGMSSSQEILIIPSPGQRVKNKAQLFMALNPISLSHHLKKSVSSLLIL